MNYVGDYTAGDTVMIYFNTFDSNDPSASVTMTNFANTDVHIHKNDNLTQRNNAAGVTVDVDVDGITGCHLIKIDTSDNTVADFFTPGADYGVRIEGVTVDAATLNPFVGHFSLENRHVAGRLVATTIATLAGQTSFTLTAGSADNDAYNNCTCVVTDIASAVQKCVGRISDYTGATKTVTLAADPGVFTMAAGDRIHIFATSALSHIDSLGADVIGAANIADDAIAAEHIAAGAIVAATLAADCITEAKIADDAIAAEHLAANAIVAATFAADCITSAKIADDAISSEHLNTGAITADAFAADAIVAATLATGALTADAFAADAIAAATLATGALTADAFAADALVAATFATDSISADALAADALAEINAEVADVLKTDTMDMSALHAQGAPPEDPTFEEALSLLYKFLRNKKKTDADSLDLYDEAGTTIDQTCALSDDGTDFIQGEMGSGA